MSRALKIFLIFSLVLLYCEYINYYLVLNSCSWPNIRKESKENETRIVRSLLLADTHLLGPYRGHWFDKLRREWQMYRAFQSAIYLHQPDTVFILGDLFDEGQWCNEVQFKEYTNRFYSLFALPPTISLHVVPGNHDLGFHYALNSYLVNKFERTFNVSSIKLLEINQIYFILINSMSLEGDDCMFCSKAKTKILEIAGDLNCLKKNQSCRLRTGIKRYTRPIILQHFPMYRKSDSLCQEPDEAPGEIKNNLFREKWDCLSEAASEMIYDKLNPRLILTGHSHHGCHVVHRKDIHEYTLSSFSWRNKNNPTFMLAKFTQKEFALEKCEMPQESTVISIYLVIIATSLFWIFFRHLKKCSLFNFCFQLNTNKIILYDKN